MTQKNIIQGFTLIELLVSIAVSGILVANSVAVYSTFKDKAYTAEILSFKHNLATASYLVSQEVVQGTGEAQKRCAFENKPIGVVDHGCNSKSGKNVFLEAIDISNSKMIVYAEFGTMGANTNNWYMYALIFHCAIQSGNNGSLYQIDSTNQIPLNSDYYSDPNSYIGVCN